MKASKKILFTFFTAFLCFSQNAKAIDDNQNEMSIRFKLIGVISDDDRPSKKRGVAVLKDIKNGVTMTLRSGDRIPYEENLKVLAVKRQTVIIGSEQKQYEVSYVGSEAYHAEAPSKPEVKTDTEENFETDILNDPVYQSLQNYSPLNTLEGEF